MDLETKELVAEILDDAVGRVATGKIAESTASLETAERARRICLASDSLDELRKGGTPDFSDPLVAALYMAQYQLQHINLAYSLVVASAGHIGGEIELWKGPSLHVVDYGCGALAMRFGVLLAVADALEAGKHIRNVKIDSLDPAVPVVQLGVEIWDRFLQLVSSKKDNKLRWLMQAIGTMERPHPNLQLGVQLKEIEDTPFAAHWLSAIHVVYGGPQGNSGEVKENLLYLREAISPDLGLITTHNSKAEMALEVSPFDGSYSISKESPSPQLTNGMSSSSCTEVLHLFRPSSWRTFWEWDPRTAFLMFQKN